MDRWREGQINRYKKEREREREIIRGKDGEINIYKKERERVSE